MDMPATHVLGLGLAAKASCKVAPMHPASCLSGLAGCRAEAWLTQHKNSRLAEAAQHETQQQCLHPQSCNAIDDEQHPLRSKKAEVGQAFTAGMPSPAEQGFCLPFL